jgi:hypothetical protein
VISNSLIESIDNLISSQSALAAAIQSHPHYIWLEGMVPGEDTKIGQFYSSDLFPSSTLEAITALNNIEFKDGQEGRETEKLKGALLVGDDVIKQALLVNECKIQLASNLDELKGCISKDLVRQKLSLSEYLSLQGRIRSVLTKAGVSRLCINQARRLLPIVAESPFRISWVQRRSDSVSKLSVDQAIAKLNKINSPQSEIDLRRLLTITDSHIAQVQKPKTPTIKANIFMHNADGNTKYQIYAPLPILCQIGNIMPKLHKGGSRTNTKRRGVTIDESVFLPSIRGHRYCA